MRFFYVLLIAFCLQSVGCAEAKDSGMPKDFTMLIGANRFSLSSPIAPEREFARYERRVALEESLFRQGDSAKVLSVHWSFRRGLLGKVAGVLELQVFIRDARREVNTEADLQEAIQQYFRRELRKIRYAGGPIPIEREVIHGRTWAKYRVPLLGSTEYSVGLSGSRYLTVQFALIDNTGEHDPQWQKDATELMRRISSTLTIE